MKTYVKNGLMTVVDDNDPRIAGYIASGWAETSAVKKPKSVADERREQTIKDIKQANLQHDVESKPLNEALKAAENAADESEAVDDGLFSTVEESKQ